MASEAAGTDVHSRKLCLIKYSGVVTLGGALDERAIKKLQDAAVEVLTHFDTADVEGFHLSAPVDASGDVDMAALDSESSFCSACNPSEGKADRSTTYCIMYLKDYSEEEMMLATAQESGFDAGYNLRKFLHSFPQLYNVKEIVATITAHPWIYDFGILQPEDVHALEAIVLHD